MAKVLTLICLFFTLGCVLSANMPREVRTNLSNNSIEFSKMFELPQYSSQLKCLKCILSYIRCIRIVNAAQEKVFEITAQQLKTFKTGRCLSMFFYVIV